LPILILPGEPDKPRRFIRSAFSSSSKDVTKGFSIDTTGSFSYSYRDDEDDESPPTLMKKLKKQKSKNVENPNQISVQASSRKRRRTLCFRITAGPRNG